MRDPQYVTLTEPATLRAASCVLRLCSSLRESRAQRGARSRSSARVSRAHALPCYICSSATTGSTIESFTLVQRSAFPHAKRCCRPPPLGAILYYKDLLAPWRKALVWTHPVPYGAASGFLKSSHVPSLDVRLAVGGPPHHGRDQRLASAKITASRRACGRRPGGGIGGPPRP